MPRVHFSLLAVSLFLACAASGQNSLSNPGYSKRTLTIANVETQPLTNRDVPRCQYAYLNYPGAYSTQLTGINNRGEIVGGWSSQTTGMYSFTWNEGSFTRVAFPNSGWTDATGVNDAGEVVGSFSGGKASAAPHERFGFLFANGKYSVINPPGSLGYAYAVGINNHHDILGYAGQSAFLLHNGKFSYFSVPNAITYPAGLNDKGEIVGSFLDSRGAWHGFILRDGKYVTIDFPGATLTTVDGINDSGVLIGTWNNGDGYASGTFKLENGIFEPLLGSVYPTGINNSNLIVGYTNSWPPIYGVIEACP